MPLTRARKLLIEDEALQGSEFARALSDMVDDWLIKLFEAEVPEGAAVALVAVGGYGRRELCPYSDLDVMLLHDDVAEIEEVASKLWYPMWDSGAKLGHSVRTPREALELASTDRNTATSMLSGRHLAGDTNLSEPFIDDALTQWRKQGRSWLPDLDDSVVARHANVGEIAFMLEPDLKHGRGGMRDVQALRWAFLADKGAGTLEETELRDSYELLLRVRVALHRVTGRGNDRLLLQHQDAVADLLGYGDADELMADVAAAGRHVAWHSDEVWVQLLDGIKRRFPKFRREPVIVGGPGVTVEAGRAELAEDTEVTAASVLRVAAAAAHHDARLSPATINRLSEATIEVPEPWSDELRELFVDLLLAGHDAIPVVETLDQLGLFVPYLPEWAPSRSRPQRNAYHRFTVDRHLWEAAAEAAALVDRVDRPDLLVVGALLHDIGKPYPGDHTEVGIELIRTIGPRMGFPPRDVDVLVAMCEHHLLLPDVATRRDIEDRDTIAAVADAVGNVGVLSLLAALTEADSIATGPAAWSRWKAALVRDLANRTEHVLLGGDVDELGRDFPSEEQRQAMRRGTRYVRGSGDVLSAMMIDRPGMFSRVAGALSLNGLDVLEAAAHTEFGIALTVFRVEPSFDHAVDWPRVAASVEAAATGRIAIESRLAERIRTYAGRTASEGPARLVEPGIDISNDTSSSATVIEISAPNGIGLLYYITRALSQLDLNIWTAKVQTLGQDVVDTFYVLDRENAKIQDPEHIAEVERALRHALAMTFVFEETAR